MCSPSPDRHPAEFTGNQPGVVGMVDALIRPSTNASSSVGSEVGEKVTMRSCAGAAGRAMTCEVVARHRRGRVAIRCQWLASAREGSPSRPARDRRRPRASRCRWPGRRQRTLLALLALDSRSGRVGRPADRRPVAGGHAPAAAQRLADRGVEGAPSGRRRRCSRRGRPGYVLDVDRGAVDVVGSRRFVEDGRAPTRRRRRGRRRRVLRRGARPVARRRARRVRRCADGGGGGDPAGRAAGGHDRGPLRGAAGDRVVTPRWWPISMPRSPRCRSASASAGS